MVPAKLPMQKVVDLEGNVAWVSTKNLKVWQKQFDDSGAVTERPVEQAKAAKQKEDAAAVLMEQSKVCLRSISD